MEITTRAVEKLLVTWDQFEEQVEAISEHFKGVKFDRVVGISRGGLPLGVVLSHRMNLPFTVVGVSSYNNETNEQETLVCNTPDILFENWGGSVLICDDIADSGQTLEFLADKISTYPQIKKFTTVTLYYKAHSVFIPDFYVIETDKWVVFPWERK